MISWAGFWLFIIWVSGIKYWFSVSTTCHWDNELDYFFFLGVLILCDTWCHQIIFIAVSFGDLWSAIQMQAALTKLPRTNIYLQQSTGSCSCRLLFIYSSLAQASCSLPVFGHLLRAEVNTWASSNFLKAKLYLQKRSLYPSHRYAQIQ